jgi:hypothetical protein
MALVSNGVNKAAPGGNRRQGPGMHHWRTVGPDIPRQVASPTMLRMVPGPTLFLRTDAQ